MGDSEDLKPRKEPAQERSREMVERLLEATARLLIAEGYRHMSTNRIAKEAGVSVGSLSQYFPNQDAMVLALFERVCERQTAVVVEKLSEMAESEGATLELAVRAVVHALLEATQVDAELSRVLLLEVTHLEGFHLLRAWLERIRALVAVAMQSKADTLRPRDLDVASFIVVNAVNGILYSAEIENRELLTDHRFADELIELIIRYLRP